MGNWKKRNAAKRRRTEEVQAAAKKSLSESVATSSDPVKSLNIEDLGLDRTLLDRLRALDRFKCPVCDGSAALFCPRCLRIHPGIEHPWAHGGEVAEASKAIDLRGQREVSSGGELQSSKGENDHDETRRISLPLLDTSDFPVKLHIITHPGEKIQKSSISGLKFLCRDYVQRLGGGAPEVDGDKTTKDTDSPKPEDASAQEETAIKLSADALPWITTSEFRRAEGSTIGPSTNASPSMFSSVDDFFRRIDVRDCALLFPAEDFRDAEDAEENVSSGAEDAPTSLEDIKEVPEAEVSKGLVDVALDVVPRNADPQIKASRTRQPKIVILIDCTWFQTDEVLQALPKDLARVQIGRYKTSFWRHHGRVQDQGLSEEHLSTVEAAYYLVKEQLWNTKRTLQASVVPEKPSELNGGADPRKFDTMLLWFVLQLQRIGSNTRAKKKLHDDKVTDEVKLDTCFT
ncbi:unnamed protein product [Amoebophrya sp. A25]|nr:unnamed protein product [Amoebophrya sp. A25]|eukprot:GSA25T00004887001.1